MIYIIYKKETYKINEFVMVDDIRNFTLKEGCRKNQIRPKDLT